VTLLIDKEAERVEVIPPAEDEDETVGQSFNGEDVGVRQIHEAALDVVIQVSVSV
jgi:hypothetical protein